MGPFFGLHIASGTVSIVRVQRLEIIEVKDIFCCWLVSPITNQAADMILAPRGIAGSRNGIAFPVTVTVAKLREECHHLSVVQLTGRPRCSSPAFGCLLDVPDVDEHPSGCGTDCRDTLQGNRLVILVDDIAQRMQLFKLCRWFLLALLPVFLRLYELAGKVGTMVGWDCDFLRL